MLSERDPSSQWGRTIKPTHGALERFVRKQNDGEEEDDSGSSSAVTQKQDASGPYHSVLTEERVWTANWINQ